VLFSISFMIPHDVRIEKVVIENVADESPAQEAGIETGDVILQIDGHEIRNRGDVGYRLQLKLGTNSKVLLQKPDGRQVEVLVKPRWKPPPPQGATGITISGTDSSVRRESMPFWKAIPSGAVKCWEILILFRNEVGGWFTKGTTPQVTGIVGIAQLTGEVAKSGLSSLLDFTALISISLGIFNLFPFPGLDGGRLVFVVLEWVRRGKRISPKKEGYIHLIGILMLIMLMLVITYFDILRIIMGESLLP